MQLRCSGCVPELWLDEAPDHQALLTPRDINAASVALTCRDTGRMTAVETSFYDLLLFSQSHCDEIVAHTTLTVEKTGPVVKDGRYFCELKQQ